MKVIKQDIAAIMGNLENSTNKPNQVISIFPYELNERIYAHSQKSDENKKGGGLLLFTYLGSIQQYITSYSILIDDEMDNLYQTIQDFCCATKDTIRTAPTVSAQQNINRFSKSPVIFNYINLTLQQLKNGTISVLAESPITAMHLLRILIENPYRSDNELTRYAITTIAKTLLTLIVTMSLDIKQVDDILDNKIESHYWLLRYHSEILEHAVLLQSGFGATLTTFLNTLSTISNYFNNHEPRESTLIMQLNSLLIFVKKISDKQSREQRRENDALVANKASKRRRTSNFSF